MRTIREPAEIASLPDGLVRSFLDRRFAELLSGGDGGEAVPGRFLVVEPGDSLAMLEEAAAWPIFHSLFDAVPAGEEGFSPAWEWIEVRDGVTEMVWVLSDDGEFVAVIVPETKGIDATLQALCAEYAVAASSSG